MFYIHIVAELWFKFEDLTERKIEYNQVCAAAQLHGQF